jgi:hypothetical protein
MIDLFLTMYRHPEMLEMVIESFNRTRKPREYRLWGMFEKDFNPALEAIFDRVRGVETKKVFREELHGINWNTPKSWVDIGAETSGEYVAQFQSDTCLSIDFLEFLDYCMTNFDVGYAFGHGYESSEPRDDRRVRIQCVPGWYGHIGCAVRTDVLRSIYPKYFTKEYRANYHKHMVKTFPELKSGGSDHFANAFLHKHGVRGARPSSSRVTNIGILGEHIKLMDEDHTKWLAMSRREKLAILRGIRDRKDYRLKSNVDFGRFSGILGDYDWSDLYVVKE